MSSSNFPGLVLLIVAALLTGSVSADQNDPRLDALFDALLETTDPGMLSQVEKRIWTLWYQHPDQDAQALLVAGERLMNAGYYGDALRVFNALIEQQPDFAEAWNRRATLHYMRGELAASIADIERTLQLEPRHFGAISGLGLVYLRQDNLLKARDAFEQLLTINPNSPAARHNLDRILEQLRSRFI
ncbi:MAG: tetratricopeptide repeat protein [Gammaproteobacteria bacterium]|nr:tetratricopeptide repeat protein [Pseudomonadales bacterium]MCP5348289.1 tetratricopeptide repeat protein [Pseudomonadales bacterium]